MGNNLQTYSGNLSWKKVILSVVLFHEAANGSITIAWTTEAYMWITRPQSVTLSALPSPISNQIGF